MPQMPAIIPVYQTAAFLFESAEELGPAFASADLAGLHGRRGVMLPAPTTHGSLKAAERAAVSIGDGSAHLSCGIEDGEGLERELIRVLDGLS